MLPRPHFRLPIWATFAIVGAAYVGRSAMRGWDFRLDLPADAVVIAMFVVVVAIVAYIRGIAAEEHSEDAQIDSGDAPPGASQPPAEH